MSGEGEGVYETVPAASFTVVGLVSGEFPTLKAQTIVEDLLKRENMLDYTEATMKLGPCQMRSNTDCSCPRQAVVEIWGIPFCKPCAREQEAYFAIGELSVGR
jgi:hypothetical protein